MATHKGQIPHIPVGVDALGDPRQTKGKKQTYGYAQPKAHSRGLSQATVEFAKQTSNESLLQWEKVSAATFAKQTCYVAKRSISDDE